MGLLFTNSPPEEVIAWFKDFKAPDFARSGILSPLTHTLPSGPVMQHHSTPPEPLPHNEEPQLRRLGLNTRMNRGVPTLDAEHVVVEKGKVITSEQAQLLKLVGVKCVEFRVALRCYWEKEGGEVQEVDEPEFRLEVERGAGEEGGEDEEDGDEVMSD